MKPLRQQAAGIPQGGQRGRHRVFHQIDQAADKIERTAAKGQFQSLVGAEKIGDHRKLGVLDSGEQEGGASLGDDPSVNFCNFEIGVNRGVDGEQLVVGPQQFNKFAQIGQ